MSTAESSEWYPIPRILIVEDENIIARDILYTLQTMGYLNTTVVSTGEESIAEAVKQNPDLVLMDIHLRGKMDGVSAAEHIYNRMGIPVIFLTAFGDEKTLDRVNGLRRFGFLNKPYTEWDLKTKIQETLLKFPPGHPRN
jgi:CheY-like chemotaxis protein